MYYNCSEQTSIGQNITLNNNQYNYSVMVKNKVWPFLYLWNNLGLNGLKITILSPQMNEKRDILLC